MNSRAQLTDQQEAAIAALLASGRYASREAIIAQGIELVQSDDAQWARLDAEIQKGLDSIARGEGIPIEEAFAQARTRIREANTKRAA